jgi:hypothetical protein
MPARKMVDSLIAVYAQFVIMPARKMVDSLIAVYAQFVIMLARKKSFCVDYGSPIGMNISIALEIYIFYRNVRIL